MVALGQRFAHRHIYTLKFMSGYVHRSTLPQSRIRSTAPSEREPGGVRTIHSSTRKPEGYGRFSSPLRKLRRVYVLPFNGRHSLSFAFAQQLPQRGSREGCVPFTRPLGNRKISGDFHRPYESSEEFTFYHSTEDTPSVSHSLDSSLREGAGKGAYHSFEHPETGRLRAIFIAPTKAQS